MTVNGEIAPDDLGNLAMTEEEIDYSALLDLSDEDIEQASSDIYSLDSDIEVTGTDIMDDLLTNAHYIIIFESLHLV